jgi:hypothetical protein
LTVLIRASLPAPLDGSAERSSVLESSPGFAGNAIAGDHHGPDAEFVQVVLDAGFAVAAVGGDGARTPPGAGDDSGDRGGELGCVGGVAAFDGVVEYDAVVVVDDLGLVAELDRPAQAALGDRAGVAVVQADPPDGPVRCDPGQPLSGLLGDPAGRGQ